MVLHFLLRCWPVFLFAEERHFCVCVCVLGFSISLSVIHSKLLQWSRNCYGENIHSANRGVLIMNQQIFLVAHNCRWRRSVSNNWTQCMQWREKKKGEKIHLSAVCSWQICDCFLITHGRNRTGSYNWTQSSQNLCHTNYSCTIHVCFQLMWFASATHIFFHFFSP